MTRRNVHWIIIQMEHIADHLSRWLIVPRHHAGRVRVRFEIDVDGAVAHGVGVLHVAAINSEGEDFFRDAEAPVALAFKEFLGRQDLAPRRARHVGDKAFHLADVALGDVILKLLITHDKPVIAAADRIARFIALSKGGR
jgi:hypothetical protein